VVLEMMKKGFRADPGIVAQLKAHQWANDAQKKDLVEKFQAMAGLEVEDVAWTAADPTPELRAAGLAILKRRGVDKAALDAVVAMARTRSEAARRGVQRFLRELAAGGDLGGFLLQVAERGDDFAKLTALEMAHDLPPDRAFAIYRKALAGGDPQLRARALKAIAEAKEIATIPQARNLALGALKDEDEETRVQALAILEHAPDEALVEHLLELARSGGAGRVVAAAFASLQRLLPVAKGDHTKAILSLLADGHEPVRKGALTLIAQIPADVLAPRFLQAFEGTFVWIRDRALETVVRGNPGFVPALLKLTASPDESIARPARELSLLIDDPRALPAWMRLLEDHDWWIRALALENIGRHGRGDEVLQRVLSLLNDRLTVLPAVGALGAMGDPRAAGPLFELFKASKGKPDDQLEILDALAQLGGPKLPKVAEVLASVSKIAELDWSVREKARRLVGKLQGDAARDALPPVVVAVTAAEVKGNPSPTLVDFLADTVAKGASDFHLATGFVPHQRIHGQLTPVDTAPTTPEASERLIRSILSPTEWDELAAHRNLDVCVKVPGLGRFRANFFSQRLGYDACFRVIPQTIPTLADVDLPESAWELARYTQGLVLVTGPAGCGKSTTLAALLNLVNETRKGHIITVEDPVEFVHPNKESLVNQRQVPHHTASFARALKAALREDPDVILVGEMRDTETMALAISASETGHLVFGTLSTTTAPATVDRIINAFPAGQQGQIRTMVSESLKAVISQTLLPRRGGVGRIAAFEILRGTPAVGALIRESKTFQLPGILQTGQLSGMNTMDQALLKLAEERKVDAEAAMDRAQKKEPFEKLVAEERLALA
jgi:twitching motility protein PilT